MNVKVLTLYKFLGLHPLGVCGGGMLIGGLGQILGLAGTRQAEILVFEVEKGVSRVFFFGVIVDGGLVVVVYFF